MQTARELGDPVWQRLRRCLHGGRLFGVPSDTARLRDAHFARDEWEAFGVAVTRDGQYPTRRAAARAITGDWLARNGWHTPAPALPQGMTWQTAEIIRHLAAAPDTGAPPAGIAEAAGIEAGRSIYTMLPRLADGGLIQLTRPAAGVTPALYKITPAGLAVAAELPPPGSGGTIPARFRKQIEGVPVAAPLHRQVAFTDQEWAALAVAAAAARTTRPRLLRAILRAWFPAGAWEAGPVTRPGVTRQTMAIITELLRTPDKPRHGADLAAATGVRRVTVYPALRRLEDQGWLTGEQEAENPRGRGIPARTLYTLTPAGLAEARKLAGEPGTPEDHPAAPDSRHGSTTGGASA